MKTVLKILCVSVLFAVICSCSKDENVSYVPVSTPAAYTNSQGVAKTNKQKVYVHYMPWFEDPSTLGANNWGYHWKMNTKNPNTILPNGRRDIASWFYPMIGTYASSNQDVIDYHFLLMKYAGIDGIIVDWYGSYNVYDYAAIRNNTNALFNSLPGTHGLEFAICYEDATLNNVHTVAGIDKITAAKQDMAYLQSNYFGSSNYIKINSNPLLMCFGPQGITVPANWEAAFSVLAPKPFFLTLQDHQNLAGANASGSFAWPQSSHIGNLTNFYNNNTRDYSFGSAYPGFKDYYSQGGAGSTLFSIPYDGTLETTLELSKSRNAKYVQIATWNDFGEGTMVEPTLDHNFSSLETIQHYTGVAYTVAELQLVYKWYNLKRTHVADSAINAQLVQAFLLLSDLKVAQAHAILDPME
jgi:hypothetical protein